jgi:hypothetical protein
MLPWSRNQNICSTTNALILTLDEKSQKQMLKKGNILQYKSNSFQLTRAQRYSYHSNNKKRIRRPNCELQRYSFTPTSSSDVPGPNMLLFWDSTQSSYYENISARNNTTPQTIDYSTLQKAPSSC